MNTLKLKQRHQQGFTLVELMVVIAITGILAVLATPSMVGMIRKNQVNTEARSLVSTLQETRSTAILNRKAQDVSWTSNRKDILKDSRPATVSLSYDYMGRVSMSSNSNCITLTHAKDANITTSIAVYRQGRLQVFKNQNTCS